MNPLNPFAPAKFLKYIIMLICLPYYAKAQITVGSGVFKKPTLQELQSIRRPQQTPFIPVDLGKLSNSNPALPTPNPILNSGGFIEQTNNQILQQRNMLPGYSNLSQQQIAEIERDQIEMEYTQERLERQKWNNDYEKAFNQLNKMYEKDSFSLTKAVFLVENAFLDAPVPYEYFLNIVKSRANHVRQILKAEKLDDKDNLALNYGIQQLYSRQTTYYSATTKQTITVPPLGYDFEDFRGEGDYTKMFVSKLMVSGKGQCHSMPLLYLMIAEQLGAKAWLSLAPQHSFIQFPDKHGNLMNFEATNGSIVSTNWLYQSAFINATAVKSKTYLDTLSQKKLFVQSLVDLLLGYLEKADYDEFAEKIRQRILELDPDNMRALIIDANNKTYLAAARIKSAGHPLEKDLPNYPAAYQAYQDMQQAYDKIDGLGYQDMPKEAYQAWLQSIEKEKQKQENKELKDKMKRDIEYLKKTKSTIIDKPKG